MKWKIPEKPWSRANQKALVASRKHWRRIVDGVCGYYEHPYVERKSPLCELYYTNLGKCGECPLATVRHCCNEGHSVWHEAIEEWELDKPLKNCQKMLTLLQEMEEWWKNQHKAK